MSEILKPELAVDTSGVTSIMIGNEVLYRNNHNVPMEGFIEQAGEMDDLRATQERIVGYFALPIVSASTAGMSFLSSKVIEDVSELASIASKALEFGTPAILTGVIAWSIQSARRTARRYNERANAIRSLDLLPTNSHADFE